MDHVTSGWLSHGIFVDCDLVHFSHDDQIV